MVPKMWGKPEWERVWLYLDPWDSVRLRTASTHWNVTKQYGPHGELFFFLIERSKEQNQKYWRSKKLGLENFWAVVCCRILRSQDRGEEEHR